MADQQEFTFIMNIVLPTGWQETTRDSTNRVKIILRNVKDFFLIPYWRKRAYRKAKRLHIPFKIGEF